MLIAIVSTGIVVSVFAVLSYVIDNVIKSIKSYDPKAFDSIYEK